MQKDEKVREACARYETVEWLYDGLGGKVIKWTHEHGSDHEDPSVLVFVAKPDGTVIERAANVSAPSSFAKWLDEQADAYEKLNPRTRVPLVRASVTGEGDGEARTVACAELDAAREGEQFVLLYVGRSEGPGDDKAARAEAKASRKFEKDTLGSKTAAAAAEGWTLLRLDVANADHARLARALGVTQFPTLLVFVPGEDAPRDLGGKVSGNALAHQLKKLRTSSPPDGDE